MQMQMQMTRSTLLPTSQKITTPIWTPPTTSSSLTYRVTFKSDPLFNAMERGELLRESLTYQKIISSPGLLRQ